MFYAALFGLFRSAPRGNRGRSHKSRYSAPSFTDLKRNSNVFTTIARFWTEGPARDVIERMYLALNGVLVSGRVKWPEFAKLAARTGYLGTDVMLADAMKDGVEKTRELLAGLG